MLKPSTIIAVWFAYIPTIFFRDCSCYLFQIIYLILRYLFSSLPYKFLPFLFPNLSSIKDSQFVYAMSLDWNAFSTKLLTWYKNLYLWNLSDLINFWKIILNESLISFITTAMRSNYLVKLIRILYNNSLNMNYIYIRFYLILYLK